MALPAAQRNHAQEEKDEELMRNISNYSNLLEQQLLMDNLNPSLDSTPSSNLRMTNLSNQDQGISKNSFESCKTAGSLFNKENKDSSCLAQNNNH